MANKKDYIPISEYNKLKEANGGKDLTKQQVSSYIADRSSGASKTQAKNNAIKAINARQKEFESFMSDYQDARNNALQAYNGRVTSGSFNNTKEDIIARNEALRQMSYYDNQAKQYSDLLDGRDIGAKDIMHSVAKEADYWNQFRTEDDYNDYNKAVSDAKERDRITKLNTAEASKRLQELRNEQMMIKGQAGIHDHGISIFQSQAAKDRNARLKEIEDEINKITGDLSAYDQIVAQPKQQAQRQQYLNTLNLDEANAELASIPDNITSLTNKMRQLSMSGDHEGAAQIEQQLYALRDRNEQLTADVREASSMQKYNAYMQLQQAPDFKELSRTINTDDANYNMINSDLNKAVEDDVIMDNRSKDAANRRKLSLINDEEKAVYNYLYAKEGAQAAEDFLASIEPKLAERNMEQTTQANAAFATSSAPAAILASAGTVVNGLVNGAAYFGQAADLAGDGYIDKNAGYNVVTRTNSAIRGAIDNDIKDHWVSKGKTGNTASFLYQTGMSMADFLFQAAVGNAVMGAGSKAAEAFTLAIMGTGAAASGTLEALDRGLSSSQAFTIGTIAGAAEIISEKVSIEALFNEAAVNTDALKYVLQNFLFEGAEEVESDVINTIADLIVSKDKSEWSMAIAQYMAQGMSEEQAFIQAMKDQAMSMGMDFLGGAVSGGIMGAGGVVGNYVRNYQVGQDLATTGYEGKTRQTTNLEALANSLIEDAKSMGSDTESGKVAASIEAKRAAGKQITMQDIGRLFESTTNAKSQALDMDENEYRQKYQAEIMSRRFENVAAAELAREGKIEAKDATRAKAVDKGRENYVSDLADEKYREARTGDKHAHLFIGTIDDGKEAVSFSDLKSIEWDKEHGLQFEVKHEDNTKSIVSSVDFQSGEAIGDAFAFAEKVCSGSDITDAKTLSDVARTAVAARMAGDVSSKQLLPGFLSIYGAARRGMTYAEALTASAPGDAARASINRMTDEQKALAYRSGENAGRIMSAKDGSRNIGKGLAVRITGRITKTMSQKIAAVNDFLSGIGRHGEIYDNINIEELRENGKISQSAQVSVWQDPSSKRINAAYIKEGNSVRYIFAANSVDTSFMFVAVHESLHDIRANLNAENGLSGEKVYQKMLALVGEFYRNQGVYNDMLSHQLNLLGVKNKDEVKAIIYDHANDSLLDAAQEELVANALPSILANESTMERFALMVATSDGAARNAFERFIYNVKRFLADAVKILTEGGHAKSWGMLKQIAENQKLVDKLYDLYEDAYERLAKQNAKASEIHNEVEASEAAPKFSVVYDDWSNVTHDDKENAKRDFETGNTTKVYRAMQLVDGKLYPPMAAVVDGKMVGGVKTGDIVMADERPDLAQEQYWDKDGKYKVGKDSPLYGKSYKKGDVKLDEATGEPAYVFVLKKGTLSDDGKKQTDVPARYNPYIHTSRSLINDQFSSAWNRGHLVTVEVEVPNSELKSGYWADKAKDAVGEMTWKSGPVSGELAKNGDPRKVILSRYSKIGRIVPTAEVADLYASKVNKYGIEVPFNTVNAELRDALYERGVKIGEPQKGSSGRAAIPAYTEWAKKNAVKFSMDDGSLFDAYESGSVVRPNDVFGEFYRLNLNAESETLARKVFDACSRLNIVYTVHDTESNNFKSVNVNDTTKINAKAAGVTRGSRVRLNKEFFADPGYDNQSKADVILHESIHAVTSFAIDLFESSDGVGVTKVSKSDPEGGYTASNLANRNITDENVIKRIKSVYNVDVNSNEFTALADFYDAISVAYDAMDLSFEAYGEYGMTNKKEFIAELANDEFRKKLKGKGFLRELLDAFLRLIGVSKEGDYSVYSVTYDALEKFLSMDMSKISERRDMYMQYQYMQTYGQKFSVSEAEEAEYMELAKDPEKNEARLQEIVDQAAKEAGYSSRMYHGSRKGGGFKEFRNWSYFTENKKYAERYAERDNESSLYSVYVKLGNTFDTRKPKDRRLFNKIRLELGLSRIQENGLPDWTDGYDITDYIDENDLQYDSVVLNEGGDLVDGKPVYRGDSYVVRESNQVKSADLVTYDDAGKVIPLSERFNENEKDIRFSAVDSFNGKNYGDTVSIDDVENAFKEWNADTFNSDLASKVFARCRELGISYEIQSNAALEGAPGDQLGKKVRLEKSYLNGAYGTDAGRARLLLHESIHACTTYAIQIVDDIHPAIAMKESENGNWYNYSDLDDDAKKKLKDKYGIDADSDQWKSIVKFVDTISNIYTEIKYGEYYDHSRGSVREYAAEFEDDRGNPMYGLENAAEFVAELSDPNFCKALKQKNLLWRIVDAVCDFLGIAHGEDVDAYTLTRNALEEFLTSDTVDIAALSSDYRNNEYQQATGVKFSIIDADLTDEMRAEIDHSAVTLLNVNEGTRKTMYATKLADAIKAEETRKQPIEYIGEDGHKHLLQVGDRVGFAATGKYGKGMLLAYGTVAKINTYNSFDEFHNTEIKDENGKSAQDRHLVPKGDKYDIEEGGVKYGYEFKDVTKLDVPIPTVWNGPSGTRKADVVRSDSIGDSIKFSMADEPIEEIEQQNYDRWKSVIPCTRNQSKHIDLTDDRNVARYRLEIDKAMNDSTIRQVVIGYPNKLLLENGFKNLPIVLAANDIPKIVYPKGYLPPIVPTNRHNLGFSALKNVVYQIADPIAITENTPKHKAKDEETGKVGRIIWTKWLDTEGRIVVCAISVDEENAIKIDMKTLFGADDGYLNDFKDAKIIYPENEKDISALIVKSRQTRLPEFRSDDIFANNIYGNKESVKMSIADTDDTRSVRDAIRENEKTLKLLAKLNGGDDSPIVRSEKLSRRQMNAIARELCERYGSSAKYKEVADILYEAFGPIFDPSVEVDSMQLITDAAAQIVDNVFTEGSGAAKLDDMLSYLNSSGPVMLSSAETQEIKSSFGTFNAFKSYLKKLGVKMQFRAYSAKEAASSYMSDSFFADLANSEVGYLFPYNYDGSQVMSMIEELDKLNDHKFVNVYGKGMEIRENAIMEIADELIARSAEYRSEAMSERISRQAGDVMSKEEEKRVSALAKQLSETAKEVRAQMERYQAEERSRSAKAAEMVYEAYQEDVLDYEEQIRVLNDQLKEIRSLDEKRRTAQRKTEQALSETKSKLMSARDHLKARASSLAQMDAYYARELAVNVDAQAQMARAEARKEMSAKYKEQIEKLRNDKKLQAKDLSEAMTAYNRVLADTKRQAIKDVKTARREGRLQRSAEVLERDLRRNYRARIAARTKTMQKMLDGTANVVVPEGARNTIGQFTDIMSQQNKKFDKDQLRMFAQFYRDMGKGTIVGDEAQDLQNMFDEDIADRFDQLIDLVGGKRISDLTSDELNKLLDITNVFYHIARHADDVRRRGRSESMKKDAMSLFRQLNAEADRKDHGQALDNIEGFLVNNQTPYYFFKQSGGVLEKYYQDIDNGVRQYTLNVQESQKRIEEIKDRYNYETWSKDTDENRIQFEAATHRQVSLTRGEAMLIWATDKREQINTDQKADHLRGGGIVMQEDRKNGKNKTLTAVANRLTDENLKAIDNWLTPEQKACADALVQYLSADMAELGNEVTMQLYGIRKFEEPYYIPYNCAGTYLNKRVGTGAVNLDNMLKTISFTQKLTTRADAPILVDDIFNVASRHIERMTMYNALCIPLDNMNRLMNYKTRERIAVDEDGHPIDVPVDGDGNPIPLYNEDGTINADIIDIHYDENGNPLTKSVVGDSIRTMLTAKRGSNAVKYIDQFIDDMNGGANTDPRESFGSRMLSLFKKNAVMMSMSVAIQQPSAIGRAFALVDPKYFAQGMATKGSYEEAKKYSYTAVLKEIGGFDTGTGRGIADWINGGAEVNGAVDKTMSKIDEVGGYLPGKMDEITWGVIWRAIKLETQAKHPDLHGEEMLQAAGARFDEVINATQVYDSTISRSSNMRSKTWYMKAATAFMAEPTVGYNLLVDAVKQGKKGDGKYAARAISSFVVAAVINSVLKSIVTAARKQDDDETYGEKYLAEFTGNMFSELNPFGLIPIAKDVISIFDGYTVSRSDMDAIQDIKDAYDTLMNDNKSAMDKINATAAAISITTGVPIRNVLRDAEAVFNVISHGISMAGKGSAQGTRLAMEEALSDVWPFSIWVKSSNKDYAARIIKDYKAGDVEAVEATIRDYQFKLDRQGKTAEEIGKKTTTWLKKAVKDAYDAKEIDYDTAYKLLVEIGDIAEKVAFKTLQAVDYDDTEYGDSSSAYVGVYDAIDNGGDVEAAIAKMIKSGYEEKTVRNAAANGVLALYKGNVEGKAKISAAQAKTMLTKYGKLSSDDADRKIKEANVFLTYGVEYTSTYSHLKEALKDGTLSKEQIIKIIMNVRGYTRDKAKGVVDKW